MGLKSDYRLIYNGDVYDAINQFAFDLEFYKKWCGRKNGSILELCCGTGRLTIPLRKAGLDITGLDLSDPMLEMARRKAEKEHLDLSFLKGDMRRFPVRNKYSTIFIAFNSLQDISSVEDVEATFASVKDHLEPDGLFLFDVFNPSIHLMVLREKEFTETFDFRTSDGTRIAVKERCKYDASTQINRVQWYFDIEGTESVEEFNMRCYFPLE
ncbi:MAG TPA: class I SAM-dependent methyltransferase, partial [Candidatus Ozemobacteraceae bacterium]|nr:class I SAM-dependent methyltransferase [Candidatus Ozemobacteraceae bacterium]